MLGYFLGRLARRAFSTKPSHKMLWLQQENRADNLTKHGKHLHPSNFPHRKTTCYNAFVDRYSARIGVLPCPEWLVEKYCTRKLAHVTLR